MKAMVMLSDIMWQLSIHVGEERDSSGTKTKDHLFEDAQQQDLIAAESEHAKGLH